MTCPPFPPSPSIRDIIHTPYKSLWITLIRTVDDDNLEDYHFNQFEVGGILKLRENEHWAAPAQLGKALNALEIFFATTPSHPLLCTTLGDWHKQMTSLFTYSSVYYIRRCHGTLFIPCVQCVSIMTFAHASSCAALDPCNQRQSGLCVWCCTDLCVYSHIPAVKTLIPNDRVL